jgi:hypothetical protein
VPRGSQHFYAVGKAGRRGKREIEGEGRERVGRVSPRWTRV